MRFLAIVKKEIIHNLRDKKAMFLMVIFPIVLILILGTAFSSSFNSSAIVKNIKVSYKVDAQKELNDSFTDFTEKLSEELDITFSQENDENIAKQAVKDGLYDSYIVLKDDNVYMYVNELRIYNANLIQTAMKSFVDRSKLFSQVAKLKPEKLGELSVESEYSPSYTVSKSIEANKVPNSKDYYSITMFTMIILYSTNIGAFSILTEKMRKTYQRVMCSKVSRISYILAKVTGCFLITCLQVLIVYLFSKYLLKANWGREQFYILIISASLVFMAVSVGVGLGEGINSAAIMAALLNMTIPVFVFFAGGYIPLSVFNSNILNTIANFSPLKWTNQALFDLIYLNSTQVVIKAILINVAVGMVFLAIPIVSSLARKDVA